MTSRSQLRRLAALDGVDLSGVSDCCYGPLTVAGRTTNYWVCGTCRQPCDRAIPVTMCGHLCSAPGCGLPAGACHERDAGGAWIADPVKCEQQRAAQDAQVAAQ